MSGIEALHWAQMYPDEVMAIIGLDMAVPESYEDYNINIPMITLAAFAANVGITRWIPSIAESGVPNIPILMFSSNGHGTGWNEDVWRTLQKNYIENAEDGEMINLDCSHYVHDIEYQKIVNQTKIFIERLN